MVLNDKEPGKQSKNNQEAIMPVANANIDRFRNLLSELFMFDRADLDFGIYRIINTKRADITRFLDEELLPQVRTELDKVGVADRSVQEAELRKLEKQLADAGVSPDASPRVVELRAQLAKSADLEGVEDDVFSHLADFFARYYKEGDFISLRRYKKGVYALPYEGEEVKLHWANADQFYIKSSEYFRNYAFRLEDGRTVHFKLVAADTEQNNNKALKGERVFVLAEDTPVHEQDGELVIRFEYQPNPQKRKQTELNTNAAQRVLEDEATAAWVESLGRKEPTEKNAERTMLERRIGDYAARNTFDYFIHRDLRGFLRRELSFYIKNEVMRLDDLEEADVPRVEQYLGVIRAIRGVGHKIIDMLAHLEDFQKRLWLKKKFVVETNYCITLDRISEGFYEEIAANDAQRQEWVRLFSIDSIAGNLVEPGYSVPLTVGFLQANPSLVLDTAFFNNSFKSRLLATFADLDDQLDGVLVHSENFQALNLIQERYRGHLQGIYIDPPYNAEASRILYKNEFEHATWLSLIIDRLLLSKILLRPNAMLCITIDDNELHRLLALMADFWGEDNHLATVPIRNNPSGRATVTGFSVNHEYGLFYSNRPGKADIGRLEHTDEQLTRYGEADDRGENVRKFEWVNLRKSSAGSNRDDRPKQFFPIWYNAQTGELRVPIMEWVKAEGKWELLEERSEGEVEILPINDQDIEKVWQVGYDTARASVGEYKVEIDKGRHEVKAKKYVNELGVLPRTWWDDPAYSARDSGTAAIRDFFGDKQQFLFPKALKAVMDCLLILKTESDSVVLDYFAGSATTAHAIIALNREDNGNRKYILVEMGEYFDAVTKPRIQKVVYSRHWRNGKPVTRRGSSHMFKYIRLESYEDTLNNLELRRTPEQQTLLDMPEARALREDYLLHYMFDSESGDTLLDIDGFAEPFSYQLKIASGSVNETHSTNIDLVETFNYLLGLRVQSINEIDGVRLVRGVDPTDAKVLVIWRSLGTTPNEKLDELFQTLRTQPNFADLDVVYVNGDNNLESLRADTETWKVRLLEEEFKTRMFDTSAVVGGQTYATQA